MTNCGRHFCTDDPDYAIWIAQNENGGNQRSQKDKSADILIVPFGRRSFFSARGNFLKAAAGQSGWHVRIAPFLTSPSAKKLKKKVERAGEPYIMLLDADCLLAENAVSLFEDQIRGGNGADIIYGDEDLLEEGGIRRSPYFKPDWSPDLLRSLNYFGAAVVYRKELLLSALDRPFLSENSGFAAFLHRLNRVCAGAADRKRILHTDGITAHLVGRKAYDRYYRVPDRYRVPSRTEVAGSPAGTSAEPKISVIVPTEEDSEAVIRSARSVLAVTSWPDYEVLLPDGGADAFEKARIRKWVNDTGDPRVRVCDHPGTTGRFEACNAAAGEAAGEYLVFLKAGVSVTTEDWLDRLYDSARRKCTGAVGAAVGDEGGTDARYGIVNLPSGFSEASIGAGSGYTSAAIRSSVPSDCAAVSADCMMVKKARFLKAGGFSRKLKILADVDFCLRMYGIGFYSVQRPDVPVIRGGSGSAQTDDPASESARLRFLEESAVTRALGIPRGQDPFYSRHLDRRNGDFSIRTDESVLRSPEMTAGIQGEEKKMGFRIDRIRCGEEIQITGHINAPGENTKLTAVRLYVRAGAARYLLADTVRLPDLRGDAVCFFARLPQRYLTRAENRIGVLVKTAEGVFREEAPGEYVVKVQEYPLSSAACLSPREFLQARERSDVAFSIDRLDIGEGFLSVRGWIFLTTDKHNDRYVLQMALRSGGNVSVLDVIRDERADVARTFGDIPNLLFCGFRRRAFLPEEIDPENAELWILFTDESTGSRYRFRCR